MASSDLDIFICSGESHLLRLVKFGHRPFLIDGVCVGIENLETVSGEISSVMWYAFKKCYCQ